MTESSAPQASAPQASAPQASADEPPKLDIEAVTAQLIVLDDRGQRFYEGPNVQPVGPPCLFALAPVDAVTKRYLYLLQQETDSETDDIVFLSMVDTHEGAGARVPPAGAWQRAIIMGTVHLLASDLVLTRNDILRFRTGHEPPPTKAQPPFT